MGAKDIVELGSIGTGLIEIDELDTENLRIMKSGTGSISIGTLTANDLMVNADGTGDIELAGTVANQELDLKGTGDYDAPDLESQTASVGVTGTGSVVLWILDSLDVEIVGISKVSYYGNPEVTQNITGTGSLTSLGDK